MIEKATVEDLDQIIKLKIRMFEDMGAKWLLAENVEDLILSRYREFYAQDTAQHVVIRDEGSIVSCAGGFIKDDPPYCFFTKSHYGFIADVYTLPAHREKGYATMLTHAVIEWLKSKDINMIRLISSPEARGIYEKIGFRQTDEMVLFMY
jgi:GNAT superfamily N-acetyltransferase